MSKSVLLVDDNRLARMMMTSIIAETRPEWIVTEVNSAEAAIELLEDGNRSFDVILIDFGLPGMNGLELAAKITSNGNAAHIALVTANIQNPVRKRAEALGATFIEKPLNAEAVVAFFSKADE